MQIQDIYRWEAERADGEIITAASPVEKRGDLRDCVRFAMTPAPGIPFPTHALSGVPMVRRFCRGFHKTRFNRRITLPGRLFWVDGETVMRSTEDWREVLTIGDRIGKGVAGDGWYVVTEVGPDYVAIDAPYHGITKAKGGFCRMLKQQKKEPSFIYLHCVECEDFRLWVNYATGEAKVTAVDHEEYV